MNQLTSFLNTIKTFQYGTVLRPVRDWFVLLTIASFCIAVSVLWNAWTFSRVASGEMLGSDLEHHMKVDTSTFDRVKAQFTHRAANADKYRFEYRFIDPSLK